MLGLTIFCARNHWPNAGFVFEYAKHVIVLFQLTRPRLVYAPALPLCVQTSITQHTLFSYTYCSLAAPWRKKHFLNWVMTLWPKESGNFGMMFTSTASLLVLWFTGPLSCSPFCFYEEEKNISNPSNSIQSFAKKKWHQHSWYLCSISSRLDSTFLVFFARLKMPGKCFFLKHVPGFMSEKRI